MAGISLKRPDLEKHPGFPEHPRTERRRLFDLDASGTTDRDGDSLSFLWFNYPEAGSYRQPIKIDSAENTHGVWVIAPPVEKQETAHFILKVTDKETPPLSRYRRVVVNILPK